MLRFFPNWLHLGATFAAVLALTLIPPALAQEQGAPKRGQDLREPIVPAASQPSESAQAEVKDSQEQLVGSLVATPEGKGIWVEGSFQHLSSGDYALLLQPFGSCNTGSEGADLMLQGAIALPAMTVSEDGTGLVSTKVESIPFSGGAGALIDADGTALLLLRTTNEAAPGESADPASATQTLVGCGTFTLASRGG